VFRDGMEILYEEEGRGFLGLSYEPFLKCWVLHVKFSPDLWGSTAQTYNIIKYCLGLFEEILNELRSRGIKLVLGLCATEKEARFNMIFGFKDTGFIAQVGENNMYILQLEL
jgi:hypothetical protein